MDTVQRLLLAGLSEGTHRMYQSAFTLFEQFFAEDAIQCGRTNTLPMVDVNIIIKFVAFCPVKGLSHNSII